MNLFTIVAGNGRFKVTSVLIPKTGCAAFSVPWFLLSWAPSFLSFYAMCFIGLVD